MRSSNHKLHASFASSLPGAAGISAAVRRGKLEISNPIPISRYDLEGPDTRFDEARERLPPLTTSAKPDTWPRGSTRPALQDCNPPAGHAGLVLKSSGPHHNTNRASAALTSTYQSMSSVRSGNSVRKSGGIKAAFRRMFGSKRRRDTFSTGADGHRSRSETVLNHTGPTDHPPLRKPSMLFEELIRARALNSHAPSVVLPEPTQADDDEQNDPTSPVVDGFSRRNSLPSAALSAQEIQTLDLALHQDGTESDHRAVLRTLRKMPNKKFLDSVKRKSRSADALRDVAQSQNTLQAQERRLSDEIKYWRNSIIEDPIPQFNSSQHVEHEEEANQSNSSQTPTLRTRRSSGDEETTSEGFEFPGLVIGNSGGSVEQRITTVEVKLVDLECAIANLQGYDVAQPVVLGKPPRRRKGLQNLSQQATARAFSNPTMVPKSSFDSYSTGSSTSKDNRDEMSEHRKSVATTIRPVITSQPEVSTPSTPHSALPTQSHTEEEFTRLMSMLTQEQEARRALESQLKDLQKQINEIRFPTTSRGPPTPSHFSTPTSNPIGPSPISTKRLTVLPLRMATPRLTTRKTSSVKENSGDDTDTDDGILDVYETPTEAREFGFGVDTPRSPPLVGVV